jgi:hypothetical protein
MVSTGVQGGLRRGAHFTALLFEAVQVRIWCIGEARGAPCANTHLDPRIYELRIRSDRALLRSQIRRKIRHATGRPMDTRPGPDYGLPDLRPRSAPRSSRGPRRAPARLVPQRAGPALVEAGGRLGSAALTGALPGQNWLGSRPVPAPKWGHPPGRTGSCTARCQQRLCVAACACRLL